MSTDTPLTGEILPMSEAAQGRHNVMLDSAKRLAQIAHRAIHVRDLKTNDFVVVCIKVDSRWRELVDILMPNHDWQQYRDMGREPIARGTVLGPICDVLIEELPDLEPSLREVYPDGMAKAIVLDDTGGTVYQIKPEPPSGIQ
jgi:hypothetical protein